MPDRYTPSPEDARQQAADWVAVCRIHGSATTVEPTDDGFFLATLSDGVRAWIAEAAVDLLTAEQRADTFSRTALAVVTMPEIPTRDYEIGTVHPYSTGSSERRAAIMARLARRGATLDPSNLNVTSQPVTSQTTLQSFGTILRVNLAAVGIELPQGQFDTAMGIAVAHMISRMGARFNESARSANSIRGEYSQLLQRVENAESAEREALATMRRQLTALESVKEKVLEWRQPADDDASKYEKFLAMVAAVDAVSAAPAPEPPAAVEARTLEEVEAANAPAEPVTVGELRAADAIIAEANRAQPVRW